MNYVMAAVFLTACSGAPHRDAVPVATQAREPLSQGDHVVSVGGVELAYHVRGKGPLCVVWPGGWAMEWTYLRMPELEKHLTLLYVEPAGTGASGRLPDPASYTLARDVAMLEELRAALGMQAFWLLGHSSGGFVALQYALAHQKHLAGLVLYDTLPAWDAEVIAEATANLQWFASEPWFADAMAAEAAMPNAASNEEFMGLLRREVGIYFYDYMARRAAYDAHFAGVRFWMEASARAESPHDVRSRLSSIRVPSLVLVGVKDAICSPAQARVIQGGIAGSQLVVLERSGHMGHLEQPVEHAAAVAGFVTGAR